MTKWNFRQRIINCENKVILFSTGMHSITIINSRGQQVKNVRNASLIGPEFRAELFACDIVILQPFENIRCSSIQLVHYLNEPKNCNFITATIENNNKKKEREKKKIYIQRESIEKAKIYTEKKEK